VELKNSGNKTQNIKKHIMPKRVIAKEPPFNFLDIHVSEIERHPTAVQDMLYNRSFEGMIIREVLPKDIASGSP
jgi:hypothetical protein